MTRAARGQVTTEPNRVERTTRTHGTLARQERRVVRPDDDLLRLLWPGHPDEILGSGSSRPEAHLLHSRLRAPIPELLPRRCRRRDPENARHRLTRSAWCTALPCRVGHPRPPSGKPSTGLTKIGTETPTRIRRDRACHQAAQAGVKCRDWDERFRKPVNGGGSGDCPKVLPEHPERSSFRCHQQA